VRLPLTFLTVAILIALLFGCATLPLSETPEIRAVSPRIAGLDFQGLDMDFDVDVSNLAMGST
jgi:hypothetical protein